jgi:hypothetical protein
MICKVCATECPNFSALLLHQSKGCSGVLAAAQSLVKPPGVPAHSASTAALLYSSALDASSTEQLPPPHSIVALDCEMVAVEGAKHWLEKSALARVAVVDWNERVLLDTFVKPNSPVSCAEHAYFSLQLPGITVVS